MNLQIEYWDCGDELVTRKLEAADVETAIAALIDDDQHPLGQVNTIVILDEVEA